MYIALHVHYTRQVVVIRKDGCILIFNDTIQERMIPDNSHFDNKVRSTLLPVRATFKTPEKLPVLCSAIISTGEDNKATLWCGTKNEMMLLFDILPSQITYCRKLYNRSRYETSSEYCVTAIASCEVDSTATYVWALTQPNNVLVCWDARKETQLNKINIEQFTAEPGECVEGASVFDSMLIQILKLASTNFSIHQFAIVHTISFISVSVTSLHAMGSQLQLSLDAGKVLLLNTNKVEITETVVLHGHGREIHQTLSIGGRIFPRHWLPTIIGRSNTIDFYK